MVAGRFESSVAPPCTPQKAGNPVFAGVRGRAQLSAANGTRVSVSVAFDRRCDRKACDGGGRHRSIGSKRGKTFRQVKNGGSFGYASVFPDGVVSNESDRLGVTRFFARPERRKWQEFADDIRDG